LDVHIKRTIDFLKNISSGGLYPKHFLGVELTMHWIISMSISVQSSFGFGLCHDICSGLVVTCFRQAVALQFPDNRRMRTVHQPANLPE
jgi:hypothetical protein